jgi:hypothetical protein
MLAMILQQSNQEYGIIHREKREEKGREEKRREEKRREEKRREERTCDPNLFVRTDSFTAAFQSAAYLPH